MWFLLLFFLLFSFAAMAQVKRYDVLIQEIMADPLPAVALPEAEYLELRNRSAVPVNLQGWRITTASAVSGLLGNFILQPDSLVILCTSSQYASFSRYGPTLAVPSFPTLPNEGGLVSLISKDGVLIHAVLYAVGWYRHSIKSEGGWSLEMIDSGSPCTGQKNWTASSAQKGGTPGSENSVAAGNRDEDAPQLLQAFFPTRDNLLLVFDEPLDSASVQVNRITIQPQPGLLSVHFADPLQQQLSVQLQQPADTTLLYSVSVSGIKDCSGNELKSVPVQTGVPRSLQPGDLVINEILYHPRAGGSDYVELYNRSKKVADLAQLFVSGRGNGGSITGGGRIGTTRYLLPGGYVVLTEDPEMLRTQYFIKNEADLLRVASMPGLPNDAGTVLITDVSGRVVDELRYSSKWQFPLIVDDAGIALERIDPTGPSQDAANWHSAAATAGYGTPGYRNSQYLASGWNDASVSIIPKSFSPDNDGHDDLALIRYQLEESGFVANVFIFNTGGRQVRHLVKNALLGKEGIWQWDGLNERSQVLPTGPYIIVSEFFNLQGRKQVYKNVVVLAGRR